MVFYLIYTYTSYWANWGFVTQTGYTDCLLLLECWRHWFKIKSIQPWGQQKWNPCIYSMLKIILRNYITDHAATFSFCWWPLNWGVSLTSTYLNTVEQAMNLPSGLRLLFTMSVRVTVFPPILVSYFLLLLVTTSASSGVRNSSTACLQEYRRLKLFTVLSV